MYIMFSSVIILEVIALCFLFLLSSIWSEENVRFGYILVPLTAAFFWWAGFLPYSYLLTVIPLMVFMGIISFMRSQAKVKMGVFGSGAGILWKLVFFLIMIQMSIGYVNGLGVFSNNMAVTPSNEYTTYTLTNANSTFYHASGGLNWMDAVTGGMSLIWSMFTVLWSMAGAVFLIYPTLVNTFMIPASLSLIIQCGIYMIYALELINMLYRPIKPVEV
jgi:hypothetical protein